MQQKLAKVSPAIPPTTPVVGVSSSSKPKEAPSSSKTVTQKTSGRSSDVPVPSAPKGKGVEKASQPRLGEPLGKDPKFPSAQDLPRKSSEEIETLAIRALKTRELSQEEQAQELEDIKLEHLLEEVRIRDQKLAASSSGPPPAFQPKTKPEILEETILKSFQELKRDHVVSSLFRIFLYPKV